MAFLAKIKSAAMSAGNLIKDAANKVFTGAKQAVTTVGNAIKTGGAAVINKVEEIGTKIVNTGADLIKAPLSIMNNIVWIVGIGVGGMVIWSLIHPKESAQLAQAGIAAAARI